MWDLDRSASRGMMACRGLYVFSHSDRLGDAPAQDLFARVSVEPRLSGAPARKFGDYSVIVDEDSVPEGVTLTRLVG